MRDRTQSAICIVALIALAWLILLPNDGLKARRVPEPLTDEDLE